jgi:hypothetical protein
MLTVDLFNTTTTLLSSFSLPLTNPFTMAVDSRGDMRLYVGSLLLLNESTVMVNVTAISLAVKEMLWVSVIETQGFSEFRYDTATDSIDLYFTGTDSRSRIARVHGSSGAVLWDVPALGSQAVNIPTTGDVILTCSGDSACQSPQVRISACSTNSANICHMLWKLSQVAVSCYLFYS